jgi:hypothetical protein
LVASLAVCSQAIAQSTMPKTTVSAQPMTQSTNGGDRHATQNIAAIKRAASDRAFIEAHTRGDAITVKKLAVRAGASSDIMIAIPGKGTAVLSNGQPVESQNNPGQCLQWRWFQWWTDIPAPGHWYLIKECVYIVDKSGVITYDTR